MPLFTYRRILVFWDIDDCPIPDGLDAVAVTQNIKTALWKQGYKGVVEITAFGDICETKEYFFKSQLGMLHCPKDAGDFRRLMILVDFLCSAIGKHYEFNFMLLVGDISQHSGFVSALRYLKSKRFYEVLLAQPQVSDKLLGTVSLGWLWPSLSLGGDPIIIHTVGEEDNYSDCKERYVAAKTAVFWDMDGCQIPQGWKADLISSNIKSALANEGCGDTVTIYAYGDLDQIDGLESFGIKPRYFPAGGDQNAKLEMILVDALCCAVDSPVTRNLMLLLGDISEHDEFTFAANVLSCINYNFLLAQPDDLEEQLRDAADKKWLWSSLLAGRGPLPLIPSLQALINRLTVDNHRRGLNTIIASEYINKQGIITQPDFSIAEIIILWDCEDCTIPVTNNADQFGRKLSYRLRDLGYGGPIHFHGCGSEKQIKTLKATTLAGANVKVQFHYVEKLIKESSDVADKKIIIKTIKEMFKSLLVHEEPQVFVLITGDIVFFSVMEEVIANGFQLILIYKEDASPPFIDEALKLTHHLYPWSDFAKVVEL